MRSNLSPSLRSRYDYYYSTLSPASSATNFYENQNLSLFGDPVPPATDFLETLDSHLYGSFRRSSFGDSTTTSTSTTLPPVHPHPNNGSAMHPAVSYNVLDETGGRTIPHGRDYMRIRTATSSSSCESSAGAQRRRPSGMSQYSTQDDVPMTTFGRNDEIHHLGGKRVNSAYSHDDTRNNNGFR